MLSFAKKSVRYGAVMALWVGMLVGLGANLPAARAESAPQIGILPANHGDGPNYFTLKAQPGQTIRDAVTVANSGDTPVKLKVYTTDATTSELSGVAYSTVEETSKAVGSWITLENSEVELGPKKQININFSLSIPKDTTAGQHLGGIAVQPIQTTPNSPTVASNQTGFGIITITRALTAVLINVGDEPAKPSLQISGAQVASVDGAPALTLRLQNDGNILLKPKGEVSLKDAAGKTLLYSKLNLDTIVPHTTIAYPVQEKLPELPGTYTVHAVLDFGGSAPATFDSPVKVSANQTANGTATSATAPNPTTAAQPPVTTGSTGTNPVTTSSNSTGLQASNASAPQTGNLMSKLVNNASGKTSSVPARSDEGLSSSWLFILVGIIAVLAAAVVGLTGFLMRTRKNHK